jgi:DNA repair protein RadC
MASAGLRLARSPQDLYAHLGVELAALEREELRILLLNTKNSCFAS